MNTQEAEMNMEQFQNYIKDLPPDTVLSIIIEKEAADGREEQ